MLGFKLDNKKDLNILCLGAHCDDIEIGCGGTILKIIENYKISHFKWVIFASNDTRKKEAAASAGMFLQDVASKEIIIKEYRDGFLPFLAAEVKDYFEELKRAFDPDLVFTHYRDDRHQDHRLVSDLTWNTWRNHLILEYEIPKYDGDLGIPNFYVPLEDKYIRRRNEILLKAFESQASKHWFDEQTFNALPRLRGMESVTRFAEAFFSRKILF
ncbi:MAG: PIG-L family deacetylase [Bacteroidales bacterium]|nr:PIG-L family deacetylase [Bacteroidales bacterium]